MQNPNKPKIEPQGPKIVPPSSLRLVVAICGLELAAMEAGLALNGSTADSWHWVIRWTAKVSAVVFLVTFLASTIRRVWPRPWTGRLLRERRYWGLSFAGSQAIHLVAIWVGYRWFPSTMGPVNLMFWGGAIAYLFTALMAMTSSDRAIRWLGGKNWRRLHGTGMYVIWLTFAITYGANFSRDATHAVMTFVFPMALAFKVAVKLRTRGQ